MEVSKCRNIGIDELEKALLARMSRRRNDTKFMVAYVAKGRSLTNEGAVFAIKIAVAKRSVFSPRSNSRIGALLLRLAWTSLMITLK